MWAMRSVRQRPAAHRGPYFALRMVWARWESYRPADQSAMATPDGSATVRQPDSGGGPSRSSPARCGQNNAWSKGSQGIGHYNQRACTRTPVNRRKLPWGGRPTRWCLPGWQGCKIDRNCCARPILGAGCWACPGLSPRATQRPGVEGMCPPRPTTHGLRDPSGASM